MKYNVSNKKVGEIELNMVNGGIKPLKPSFHLDENGIHADNRD